MTTYAHCLQELDTQPVPADEDRDASGEEVLGDENCSEGSTPDSLSGNFGASAARGLPSVGSALHAAGKCSRCCFYLKNRCRNGINCQFCHLPHERRARGRGCRGHGSQRLSEVQDAAQGVSSPPGLVRAPPGLDTPSDGLMERAYFTHGCAFSQPPTPQASRLPPVSPPRMAISLPATPQGVGSKCMPRVGGPLLLPPLHPPRCLPQGDQAPPPPENSPGGPLLPAPRSDACQSAVPGKEQEAIQRPVVNAISGSKPPGTFFPREAEGVRTAAPILGTLPSHNGASLPRLLGSRGPPGLETLKAPSWQAHVSDGQNHSRLDSGNRESLRAETEVHPGCLSKPLKVFMTDYDCQVPALNPAMPAKKRLPEWL